VAVATVDIQINSQGAVRSLNQVDVASRNTQSALQKLDGVVGSLAASFAAGFAINRVINDVKELDTNIRRLGTVGVNVAKINPALSALSDRLGGVANKAELAAASYQAASAGFSDTAGNIRILEAATKAATGGLADNQGVTEVLVKTLNAYGMSGTQAYQVTDSISKAVELGNQEWSDYVSQLGRVASMAALSGVSLDEMNAFIASATKNGATAEVAFTGLSAVLTQLLQPTKESQTAAAKLGIQWNLMGLQTKGLGGLMKELAVAIDKDKEAAARMVGPTEAMRGAFAAASKDGKDFRDILGQIGNASGKTDADFQTMKGSLDNTFKALDTSFKNLSEALGKAFGPTLVITIQDITKGVNGFADAMDAVPQPVMNATGELIKLIAQMILVQKAIQGVIGLHVAFVAATTAITGSVAASGTAATGSATAFALYTTNVRTLQAASIATAGSVSGLSAALLGLAGIGIVTVGINYVITQTGAVLASADAAQKSLAARSQQSLAGQLKGKTVEERQKMLKITQKNLANDRKLASTLALQVRAQDARAESAAEMAAPADRAKLIEVQARVKTNQARIKAITSIPLEKPKKPELPPTPALLGETGGGKTGSGAANKAANDAARLAEQTKTQLDAAYKLNALAAADLDIQMSMTKEETLQGQFDKAALERKFKYADLQKNFKSEQERQLIASAQESEILIANNKYAKDKKDLLEQQTKELYSQLDISGVLDKTLQKRLSGAFMGKSATTGFRTDINLDPSKKAGKIQEYVDKAKTDLADVQGMVVSLATTVESSIGSAMSNAISGVIQGTTTVLEAFSSMFKSIGDAFIQMATQMIAKALIMKVLGILGSAAGGNFSANNYSGAFGAGSSTAFNPSTFGGGMSFFADGGYVNGPTNAIIGEGGQSEYVIPASKMSQAMSNYSAGKRGASILGDSTSMGDGSMGSSTGAFTLETVVINNIEYATVDQVRAMSSAAAKQGAEGGFSRSMSSLRNSRSQRSRLGMR